MRIALLTYGSRGDVQPIVALAAELTRRGHDVSMTSPPNTLEWCERAGVKTDPLPVDTQEFMESKQGQVFLAKNQFYAVTKAMAKEAHAHALEADDMMIQACKGADALVTTFLTEERASVIAEAWNLPLTLIHFHPVRPTTAMAHPLITWPDWSHPAWVRGTHLGFQHYWWYRVGPDVNVLRKRLGLPATRRHIPARTRRLGHREVEAYSPHVVPQLDGHWPDRPLVGFMELGPEERARLGESGLDPAVRSWIEAGERPYFMGFGSMPILDPPGFMAMIEGVVAELGIRAVVGAGWGKLPDPSPALKDRILMVGSVDHSELFPLIAGAVHHGGAGTLAASLKAGVPTLVASVFADQWFWGKQTQRIGAGAHVQFHKLNRRHFSDGMRRIMDPTVVARAAQVGEAMRHEPDAVSRIADEVEANLPRR